MFIFVFQNMPNYRFHAIAIWKRLVIYYSGTLIWHIGYQKSLKKLTPVFLLDNLSTPTNSIAGFKKIWYVFIAKSFFMPQEFLILNSLTQIWVLNMIYYLSSLFSEILICRLINYLDKISIYGQIKIPIISINW